MKNTKIILTLVVFFASQAVLVAIFFMGFKSNIVTDYRKGVSANFDNIVSIAEQYKTDLADFDEALNYIYKFDNVFIVETDGYISYAYDEAGEFAVGTKFNIFNVDQLFLELIDTENYMSEVNVKGINSLVLSRNIGDFAVVAYQDLKHERAFGGFITAGFILLEAVQVALISGLIYLLLKIFHSKTDSLYNYKTASEQYYIFEMDNAGNLTGGKSNVLYKKYGIENLTEYIHATDSTIAKALAERVPFSIQMDEQDRQAYFHCVATRKPGGGYRILAIDDSKQYFENKKISEHVLTDSVISLRNKSGLEIDLQVFVNSVRREQKAIAIFNFKNLNNIEVLFGNSVKIKLLQNCAKMFREKFNDKSINIYYFDEKIVILTPITSENEEIKQAVKEFNNSLNTVIKIDNCSIHVQSDLVFLYLEGSANNSATENVTLEEILEYNDYMTLDVKNRVDSNFMSEIFNKSKYYHSIGSKKELTKKIIDQNRFDLFFQPQVRLLDGKLMAFEALVRLNESSLNTQDFIIISEVNGFMLRLGESITIKALDFARIIRHTGINISINLSPVQLLNKGFVDNFLDMYKSYELNDYSVAIEITETFLMSDIEENIKKLQIMHGNKIAIHLDDFGMGYSSLAYLKNFPVDCIKIDREFVNEIETDDYSRAICNFVIQTARQLKIETIAEGIEQQTQADALKTLGCDMIQGYFSGKPMSVENAVRFIDSNKELFADNKELAVDATSRHYADKLQHTTRGAKI